MIVVSDTGPLNYLALIGHVEALPKLYEVVVIPKAVASELSRPSCPETVRALVVSPPVWLRIDQATESDPDLGALGRRPRNCFATAHDYRSRTSKPACSKWWSVVRASRIPRSCIRANDVQSVTDHDLSRRDRNRSTPR